MNNHNLLTDEQSKEFRDTGLLVIPGFYDLKNDILPIQKGIYDIIGQVLKRHGLPDSRAPFSPDKFDDGYQELIAIERSYGSEVYDAVKQIPAFIRLVCHERNEDLFCELRPGSIPGVAAGGFGIRIDNPLEDKFRVNWHQEYPAQLRSLDGVVYWSPLLEVTNELGPVKFCPGSHHGGAIPVYTKSESQSEKAGAYALKLQDEEVLINKYKTIAPTSKPGDLIVVDFLLLHASGINTSKRSRWSMQLRYFNFDEPTGIAHGWKGSYAAGINFKDIHPELCLD